MFLYVSNRTFLGGPCRKHARPTLAKTKRKYAGNRVRKNIARYVGKQTFRKNVRVSGRNRLGECTRLCFIGRKTSQNIMIWSFSQFSGKHASRPKSRKTRCIYVFFNLRAVLQKRFLWENIDFVASFRCNNLMPKCSFVRRRGASRTFVCVSFPTREKWRLV